MAASGLAMITVTRSDGTVEDLRVASDVSTCYIETKDLDGGVHELLKWIKRIYPHISGTAVGLSTVRLEIGRRNDMGEEVQWEPPLSLEGASSVIKKRFKAARYFKFRWSDTAISERWKLFGWVATGGTAGAR